MSSALIRSLLVCGLVLAFLTVSARADVAAPKPLLDVQADGAEARLKASAGTGDQATVARSDDKSAPGLVVTFQPGKSDYPGVALRPDGAAAWDLSAYGHIEVRVTNTGSAKLG